MQTDYIISSDKSRLARVANDASRHIENSRVLIEESLRVLATLKITALEYKYFVECSFDYLYNSPDASNYSKPINNILYFNTTDKRSVANE